MDRNMSNTTKCFIVAAAVIGSAFFARHQMNTANEDFDFSLTTDWSSSDMQGKWEAVVAEEAPEQASMDDVFHAAIAPRQARTAAVIR